MKSHSGKHFFLLLPLNILASGASGNSPNYAEPTSFSNGYSKSSSCDETIMSNKPLSQDAHSKGSDRKEHLMASMQSSETTFATSSFEDESGTSMSFSSISAKSSDTANNGGINRGTGDGSSTTSSTFSRDGKFISLDLAGEVHTHVLSPCPFVDSFQTDYPNGCMTKEGSISPPTTVTTTTPLFYWRGKNARQIIGGTTTDNGKTTRKRSWLPHLYVGSQYDFKKVWWGATRLMGTLSWGNDNRLNQKQSCFVSKLKGEVGTLHPHDYSLEAGFKFPSRLFNTGGGGGGDSGDYVNGSIITDMDTMVSVKYNSLDKGLMKMVGQAHSATMAARLRLHNRFAIMIKGSVANLGDGVDEQNDIRNEGFEYFQHRIPQEQVKWSEGSWLPDVKMTAGGKVVARSMVGLRNSYQSFDDKNRAYITFNGKSSIKLECDGDASGNRTYIRIGR
jgi:hypothetical protein